MIKVHHLGVSQSDRVIWLLEELGQPYEMVWHSRGADGLMPPSYVALHPASTAPVVEDDGRMLCESAAILEHICHKYGGGRFTVKPGAANYYDYVYWMHFNNNVLGLFFARLAMGPQGTGPAVTFVSRREEGYARHLEETLASRPYLAGDEFTCADIMTVYDLTSLPLFRSRDLPNVKAYVERIGKRPAYLKTMQIAGPAAKPPSA